MTEGGGLAGSTDWNDSGNPGRNLTLDKMSKGRLIQGAILSEGCNQGGVGAGKRGEGHGKKGLEAEN
jgi:hypothetical protein